MTAAPTLAPGPAHARHRRASALGRWLGRNVLYVYTAARDRLPDAADRGHDRLQLQRPGRQVQLHLGGLQPRRLAQPVRRRSASRTPSSPASRIAFLSTIVATDPRDAHRPGPDPLPVPRPGRDEPVHLPADGDAGDRPGRLAPDDVRRRSASRRERADDPHRPHHVQHQLRRRDRPGPPGRASRATSRRRRWTSAPTSG